jgi:DNA-binding SARP family transcriptional activator
MAEPLHIKTLGRFHISHAGHELDESNLKMKQLLTLLSYLTYNKDKQVHLDTLYPILWPGENSDNPSHALRNLVYRIRTILKKELDPDVNYILTLENNSYCWNPEIEVVSDIEQFEKCAKIGADTKLSAKKRVEALLEADSLYLNDFMIALANQDWITPIATYYRYIYNTAAANLTELLLNEGRLDEALKVCLKASAIDSLNEKTHRNIIDIYFRLGQTELAIKYYKFSSNLFVRELGVKLSKETRNLYRYIKSSSGITAVDINAVAADLSKNDHLDIPLFCDYETFRHLYSLQIRNHDRISGSLYLYLITAGTASGKIPDKPTLDREMKKLADIIKNSLRRNDVVTAYSESQYILMLGSLTAENAEMLKTRLSKAVSRHSDSVEILFSISSISV